MIRLSINGRIAKKDRIEKYIQLALFDMMPRLRRIVDVELNVVTKCDEDNYALCWGDKNEVEIELARTSGKKKFTHDEMMLNLAHEIVPFQFIKGESPHYIGGRSSKRIMLKLPLPKNFWEKEAYLMEDKIFEKY